MGELIEFDCAPGLRASGVQMLIEIVVLGDPAPMRPRSCIQSPSN
jgi:hypothetical protein